MHVVVTAMYPSQLPKLCVFECSKVRKFRCQLPSLVSRLFTLLMHTIVVWVVIHFDGGACFNVFLVDQWCSVM